MSAAASFLDIFDWWRMQLAELFHQPGQPSTVHESDIVHIRMPPIGDKTDTIAFPDAGEGRSSVMITVAADHFLSRTLSSLNLPRRRAEAMAEIDLMAGTPIDPTSVFIVFGAGETASRGTCFHVIKKKVIAPIIDAAVAAGAKITTITLEGSDGPIRLDRRSVAAIAPEKKSVRISRYSLTALYALCALGVLVTSAQLKSRYSDADTALDAEIARVSPEARQVRDLLDRRENLIAQIAALREQSLHAESLIRMWEELTRIIPDTAWITDLEYNARSLRISGLAVSAAGLIPALEASSFFDTPTFMSPVVRVPGQDGERFTISMEIERP